MGRKGGGIAVRVDNSHSLMLERCVCESTLDMQTCFNHSGPAYSLYFWVIFNCVPMTHNILEANAY